MSAKPKSYQEMMRDMINDTLKATSATDLNVGSAVEALAKALEAGLYAGCPDHEVGVRRLLEKFNIKSAWDQRAPSWGGPLRIEGLEATLKNVTFDDKKIKLWKKP